MTTLLKTYLTGPTWPTGAALVATVNSATSVTVAVYANGVQVNPTDSHGVTGINYTRKRADGTSGSSYSINSLPWTDNNCQPSSVTNFSVQAYDAQGNLSPVLTTTATTPAPTTASGAVVAVWANAGMERIAQTEVRKSQPATAVAPYYPSHPTTDSAFNGSTVTLSGLRNRWNHFGLVLETGALAASNVSVTLDVLTGPGGATIRNTRIASPTDDVFNDNGRPIQIYAARYITLPGVSRGLDGNSGECFLSTKMRLAQDPSNPYHPAPGLTFANRPGANKAFPDPLIPQELAHIPFGSAAGTVPIAANNSQFYVIDVFCDKAATPGAYTGTIQVKESGVVTKTLPITVTVSTWVAPDVATKLTCFDFLSTAVFGPFYPYSTASSYVGAGYRGGAWNDTKSKTITHNTYKMLAKNTIYANNGYTFDSGPDRQPPNYPFILGGTQVDPNNTYNGPLMPLSGQLYSTAGYSGDGTTGYLGPGYGATQGFKHPVWYNDYGSWWGANPAQDPASLALRRRAADAFESYFLSNNPACIRWTSCGIDEQNYFNGTSTVGDSTYNAINMRTQAKRNIAELQSWTGPSNKLPISWDGVISNPGWSKTGTPTTYLNYAIDMNLQFFLGTYGGREWAIPAGYTGTSDAQSIANWKAADTLPSDPVRSRRYGGYNDNSPLAGGSIYIDEDPCATAAIPIAHYVAGWTMPWYFWTIAERDSVWSTPTGTWPPGNTPNTAPNNKNYNGDPYVQPPCFQFANTVDAGGLTLTTWASWFGVGADWGSGWLLWPGTVNYWNYTSNSSAVSVNSYGVNGYFPSMRIKAISRGLQLVDLAAAASSINATAVTTTLNNLIKLNPNALPCVGYDEVQGSTPPVTVGKGAIKALPRNQYFSESYDDYEAARSSFLTIVGG